VNETPAQLAGLHSVEVPLRNPTHLVTSFAPSHAAAAQVLPAPSLHFGLPPCGAPLTAVQTPTFDMTSHASHCPAHSPLQQTPSTQKPLPHSSAVVHPLPPSLAQVPFFPGIAQELPAAHVAAPQHTPSVQKRPMTQAVGPLHSLPRSVLGTQVVPLQ
jgi:hypothetical protein